MKTEPFTTQEFHARLRAQLGLTQAETGKPTEAETGDWPTIEEQRKYWETHDIGGNVLKDRVEANNDFYQAHRPFIEEEYAEFGEFRSLNDGEINDEENHEH